MATTTNLLQHPTHDHPLVTKDISKDSIKALRCDLCSRNIWADAYTCQEKCESYYIHRVCAEAPPQIYTHPLHAHHQLTLIHRRPPFDCDACYERYHVNCSSYRCEECDFDLDMCCALYTLSDRVGYRGGTTREQIHLHHHHHISDRVGYPGGTTPEQIHLPLHLRISDRVGYSGGTTPEQIHLPLHLHMLTSFSTRHDFVRDGNCVICKARVEGDGHVCLHRECEFLIHKACIQDLYYADGSKAPRIYHRHPLKTFLGEDMGLTRCASYRCSTSPREFIGCARCKVYRYITSSGDFIGCATCKVFIHRICIQEPEIIQYLPHPDHNLVLCINSANNDKPQCSSCLGFLKGELCYGCLSCEFFAHVGCVIHVHNYCDGGMSPEIKLSWHKHPLLLCHRNQSDSDYCSCCEDKSAGPMYACNEKSCHFLVHKRCTEIKSTIDSHQHHQHRDHSLTLCRRDDFKRCEVCCETIRRLSFSCELCEFYLHAKCAIHVPTRKHYLHEHELLYLNKAPSLKCNRCGTSTDSPIFRCVPCNFNLHEACMELPRVVKSEIHWHPLTLHETFIEDDSGEYYCQHCMKNRDIQLGAYVCGECKTSLPRIYHIECVLPELWKGDEKKIQTSVFKRVAEKIATSVKKVLKVLVNVGRCFSTI